MEKQRPRPFPATVRILDVLLSARGVAEALKQRNKMSKPLEKGRENGGQGHVFTETGVSVLLWAPGRFGSRKRRKFLLMVFFYSSMKNEVPS